ncbi:hypothetical protein [Sphingomonas sp. BK235]|uniref:DUF6894 family protein n=1 Tax=Sphingomonas sp. BK235 TaxID=2512131 RepID=UPI0010461570|nr:hypothetical protein [Sphingomonas sp. BK235]TCP29346.1 hypothetical protein EV292_11923 [Sphingomonas sp. BK235]
MPRFLFHLHECGVNTHDDSGRELPDLTSAIEAARADALSIMAHEVYDGHLCLSCHIEVEEPATGKRTSLPFRDVLKVTGI